MAVRYADADVRSSAPDVRWLTDRVRAEYKEMPGLSVTMSQAQRLWSVDRATCEEVFARLVAKGVLRMTKSRRFVRN